MITKLAEAILNPHQQRVIDKLEDPDLSGVLAYHNVGGGKTLTALKAVENAQKKKPGSKVIFVVPASLRDNVFKEIAKHGLDIDLNSLEVLSYNKAINRLEELEKMDPSLVIIDEAHNLRNFGTARHQSMKELIEGADKSLLLTGTMSYNNINDFGPLVNLVAKDNVFPNHKMDFDKQYVKKTYKKPGFFKGLIGVRGTTDKSLKNRELLSNKLNKYVDFHDSATEKSDDYPSVATTTISTEMDDEQKKIYDYLMYKIPLPLRRKIERGMPPSKQEARDLNAFVTGFRQVSNSVNPYVEDEPIHISPKLQKAVENLAERMKSDPGHRAVAYSNYLDAGIVPYAQALRQKGIDPVVFTGALTEKQKKAIIDDFNSDPLKSKVLLLSSSGGEGLDLKGVRSVQILEPHFNKSKIDQVIGRAARYKSHAHLPEDQRNVLVEYYQSRYPRSLFDKLLLRNESKTKSVDQYLHAMSMDKDKLIQEMRGLLN